MRNKSAIHSYLLVPTLASKCSKQRALCIAQTLVFVALLSVVVFFEMHEHLLLLCSLLCDDSFLDGIAETWIDEISIPRKFVRYGLLREALTSLAISNFYSSPTFMMVPVLI